MRKVLLKLKSSKYFLGHVSLLIPNSRVVNDQIDCVYLITRLSRNKAGYTATEVACEWAGAIFDVTTSFEQEQ